MKSRVFSPITQGRLNLTSTPEMEPLPTVFIVDDDELACRSLQAFVRSMDLACQAFASAEEFLAAYSPHQRGCLVTDVRMLGMSGLELQDELNRRRIRLPVIVITGFADTQKTVRAMRSGAVTLLEKPCEGGRLSQAIREALQQDAQQQHLRAAQSRLDQLTPQEQDVLKRVLQGKANKNIARELDVSVRTIENRRQRIMQKTETKSVPELVRLVMECEK